MHMRPYAGLDDLVRMKALTSAGLQRSPDGGYHHPGDMDWWLFYGAQDADWRDLIMLWEDGDELVAWVILEVPPYIEFDFVLHPRLRETELVEALIGWGEEKLAPASREAGKPIEAFAWADDFPLQQHYQRLNYSGGEPMLTCFSYALDEPTPAPLLPEGFTFLEAMTPEWAARRADAHFDAFTSSKMTPAKYRRFMDAPNYDPALDVAVVAPDGSIAAFAMCWVDAASGVGKFEPVGTRTAMQRRGLGRAAMHEGLRRLRARGMAVANVHTRADNAGNLAFYANCGFRQVNAILKYEKQG